MLEPPRKKTLVESFREITDGNELTVDHDFGDNLVRFVGDVPDEGMAVEFAQVLHEFIMERLSQNHKPKIIAMPRNRSIIVHPTTQLQYTIDAFHGSLETA